MVLGLFDSMGIVLMEYLDHRRKYNISLPTSYLIASISILEVDTTGTENQLSNFIAARDVTLITEHPPCRR
eukprot:snap_masked-scaffold_120-processed-gene-0.20-mRNA-1 protein AED:1.00 eAED:1.00 QI:0/0/0/0/1/1/2/0/70